MDKYQHAKQSDLSQKYLENFGKKWNSSIIILIPSITLRQSCENPLHNIKGRLFKISTVLEKKSSSDIEINAANFNQNIIMRKKPLWLLHINNYQRHLENKLKETHRRNCDFYFTKKGKKLTIHAEHNLITEFSEKLGCYEAE